LSERLKVPGSASLQLPVATEPRAGKNFLESAIAGLVESRYFAKHWFVGASTLAFASKRGAEFATLKKPS
jgi:hypothetical protein